MRALPLYVKNNILSSVIIWWKKYIENPTDGIKCIFITFWSTKFQSVRRGRYRCENKNYILIASSAWCSLIFALPLYNVNHSQMTIRQTCCRLSIRVFTVHSCFPVHSCFIHTGLYKEVKKTYPKNILRARDLMILDRIYAWFFHKPQNLARKILICGKIRSNNA